MCWWWSSLGWEGNSLKLTGPISHKSNMPVIKPTAIQKTFIIGSWSCSQCLYHHSRNLWPPKHKSPHNHSFIARPKIYAFCPVFPGNIEKNIAFVETKRIDFLKFWKSAVLISLQIDLSQNIWRRHPFFGQN